MIDTAYYPATDTCDWEPLRRALDPCRIDGWMFMCVGADGTRYYKHSTTRESLALPPITGGARPQET